MSTAGVIHSTSFSEVFVERGSKRHPPIRLCAWLNLEEYINDWPTSKTRDGLTVLGICMSLMSTKEKLGGN